MGARYRADVAILSTLGNASSIAAIKAASPSRIEALDMGRRSLHNEGSELLQARLEGNIEADFNTARRLFTLVCVLHLRV